MCKNTQQQQQQQQFLRNYQSSVIVIEVDLNISIFNKNKIKFSMRKLLTCLRHRIRGTPTRKLFNGVVIRLIDRKQFEITDKYFKN